MSFLEFIELLKLSIFDFFVKNFYLQKENLNIDFKHIKELQDMCYEYYEHSNFKVIDCFFAFDIKNGTFFFNSIKIEENVNIVKKLKNFILENPEEEKIYDVVIFNSFCTMFIKDFRFWILFDDKVYRDNIILFTDLLISTLINLLNETSGIFNRYLLAIFYETVNIMFPYLLKNFQILKNFHFNLYEKVEEKKIFIKQLDGWCLCPG